MQHYILSSFLFNDIYLYRYAIVCHSVMEGSVMLLNDRCFKLFSFSSVSLFVVRCMHFSNIYHNTHSPALMSVRLCFSLV